MLLRWVVAQLFRRGFAALASPFGNRSSSHGYAVLQKSVAAYYEQVGEDHADDLRAVWDQWNRGSGAESQAFIDTECRSLSVGDIVIFDGDSYLCRPIGWQSLALSARDEGGERQ